MIIIIKFFLVEIYILLLITKFILYKKKVLSGYKNKITV